MIGRLRGAVVERDGNQAVIEVQGVGYLVTAPGPTLDSWQAEDHEIVAVVHTVVREDAITLFAFATRTERTAFEVLIGVNKVGAKIAMAALDTLGLEGLRRAVETSDVPSLCRIPGVGKRTAQRLALELQGKLPAGEFAVLSAASSRPAPSSADDTFALALQQLGWGKSEIDAARARLEAEGVDASVPVHERVRAALRSSIRR
ncbi:MAG: Holliday junction branch migration protein RuvA [Deltaproteobacteria bacterium]|nr:MAG: Holliday junction branch migration protein RuvA [Deltaproteobacteria bacterium]